MWDPLRRYETERGHVHGRLINGRGFMLKCEEMDNQGDDEQHGSSSGSFEMLLFDEIGAGFLNEGITARNVIRALDEHRGKDVTVRINSPGGDVFEGVAIHNALARHEGQVTVVVDALAASAAAVIAMAGNRIQMVENGAMMIHEPWTLAIGDAAEMRAVAEVLDTINDGLVATFVARTSLTKAKVRELLRAETWMGAEEAQALGFVDEVVQASGEPRSAEDREKFSAQARDGVRLTNRRDLVGAAREAADMVERHAPEGAPRTCPIRNGERLASTLNDAIDESVTDDRSRSDVIEDMAEEAGIDTSTVNQILRAEINCPPLDRLRGFARVLPRSFSSLRSAAEQDGCDYGDAEDSIPASQVAARNRLALRQRIDALASDESA